MERKTTSIKVSPELWEEVKINCIRQKIDISDWLEEIIKQNLGKPVKQKEIKKGKGKVEWNTVKML